MLRSQASTTQTTKMRSLLRRTASLWILIRSCSKESMRPSLFIFPLICWIKEVRLNYPEIKVKKTFWTPEVLRWLKTAAKEDLIVSSLKRKVFKKIKAPKVNLQRVVLYRTKTSRIWNWCNQTLLQALKK